jgi:hypothetical protein
VELFGLLWSSFGKTTKTTEGIWIVNSVLSSLVLSWAGRGLGKTVHGITPRGFLLAFAVMWAWGICVGWHYAAPKIFLLFAFCSSHTLLASIFSAQSMWQSWLLQFEPMRWAEHLTDQVAHHELEKPKKKKHEFLMYYLSCLIFPLLISWYFTGRLVIWPFPIKWCYSAWFLLLFVCPYFRLPMWGAFCEFVKQIGKGKERQRVLQRVAFRDHNQRCQGIFSDMQVLLWSVESLSEMASASVCEDSLGTVQTTLPVILTSLLGCLLAVEEYVASPAFHKAEVQDSPHTSRSARYSGTQVDRSQPRVVAYVLEKAIFRIVDVFYEHLDAFSFPPVYAAKLQTFMDLRA